MQIGAEREIDERYLCDTRLAREIVKSAISDMKYSVLSEFIDEIEWDKSYVIKLRLEHERSIRFPGKRLLLLLDTREVLQETIEMCREYKIVTVESLTIESISCRNCAAPIPVGQLDRSGDTLVRCSYCGTYHTVRKKK